jgi:hypothetical protein
MLDPIDWTQVSFVDEPVPPQVELKTRPFRTVLQIKQAVAKRYRVTVADLESPCRKREFVVPRQIAMALAVRRLQPLGYSFPAISRAFGNRHHTTVLWAAKKYGYRPLGRSRDYGCKIPHYAPPVRVVPESRA